MNKTFVATLALSLLAGTSALAQDAHQHGDWKDRVAQHRQDQATQQADGQARRDDARRTRDDDNRPARPVPQVSNERAQEAIAQARARQAEHDNVAPVRRDDHRDGVMAQVTDQAVARREAAEHRSQEQRVVVPRVTPRPDDHRQADRDRYNRGGDHYQRPGDGHQLRDRDHDRQWYNPDQWRRTYHATHRYRPQHYRTPPGFYLRSWVFGDFLPRAWYAPSYYLDWWSYGLPRPPIGTEWIRSGDDALLVDTWSGEVLSVYYDLFW